MRDIEPPMTVPRKVLRGCELRFVFHAEDSSKGPLLLAAQF